MMRVLIVDDEPAARLRIRRFLGAHRDVEVAGECASGRRAVDAIAKQRPDLVFLDVEMPDMDGFEVIRRVGVEHMPPVVFVTAHDAYAIRGFEVAALDYLLKPFDEDRFVQALRRGRRAVAAHAAGDGAQLARLLERLEAHTAADPASAPLERLLLHERGRKIPVRVLDIDWIEAADNYVRLHVGGKQHLHRATLRDLGERLDPVRFRRIHRSTIVNMDRVKEIRPWFSGDQIVVLADGTELRASRAYRSNLEATR